MIVSCFEIQTQYLSSPESLHFFLQQLSMGPPCPGGAGRGLLIDSLLGQGLGEGQGTLLHYWAAATVWISGREAQQCCDRWLGWTACDWPDLTLSWEITKWWSGDQGEECVDSERSERGPGQAGHCCSWYQGSPGAGAWETWDTSAPILTLTCTQGVVVATVDTGLLLGYCPQIDGHNGNQELTGTQTWISSLNHDT